MKEISKNKKGRKTHLKKIAQISALGLLGMMLLSPLLLCNQETDPFYHKLLREGEKSYLNKNYEEAAEKLEIAKFGLHGDKKSLAKAYVYLILSYRYLKNMEKCEEYLKKAVGLLNLNGLEELEIDTSSRNDFENLLNYFNAKVKKEEPEKSPKKPQLERPERNTKPKELEKIPLKTKYQELQERIKAEPQNLAPYLELYKLHRENDEVKAARNVIQDLIHNNPDELVGPHLMGKIEFSQRNYTDALTYFKQVLRPLGKIQVENPVVAKSLIYISLCLYHLGRRELQESFVKLIKDNISAAQLLLMLQEEELEKEWEETVE